jgi:hypothetical protein
MKKITWRRRRMKKLLCIKNQLIIKLAMWK